MKLVPRAAIILSACLFVQGPANHALAHDYWLESSKLPPSKSEEMALHLQKGDHFKADEERPLQKDRVARFDLYGDHTARRDLLAAGQDNQVPVARFRLEGGSALVVMDRKPRLITMEPERFNQYLADEGLDTILAQRARLGQTNTPGRESYSRYLKTLVQEGNSTTATANTLYKRRVGQRLEILLENDPVQLSVTGGELTVKVLFEGNPLSGVKVSACCRVADDQPSHLVTATTSAKGLAKFKLDQPGSWLVRAVAMRAVAAGPKTDAAWESFWATYTFNVRISPPAVSGNAPQ